MRLIRTQQKTENNTTSVRAIPENRSRKRRPPSHHDVQCPLKSRGLLAVPCGSLSYLHHTVCLFVLQMGIKTESVVKHTHSIYSRSSELYAQHLSWPGSSQATSAIEKHKAGVKARMRTHTPPLFLDQECFLRVSFRLRGHIKLNRGKQNAAWSFKKPI